MKLDKKVLLVSAFILLLIILRVCQKKEVKELEYPLGGPIPQSDILFMPDADPTNVAKKDSKTFFSKGEYHKDSVSPVQRNSL